MNFINEFYLYQAIQSSIIKIEFYFFEHFRFSIKSFFAYLSKNFITIWYILDPPLDLFTPFKNFWLHHWDPML